MNLNQEKKKEGATYVNDLDQGSNKPKEDGPCTRSLSNEIIPTFQPLARKNPS